ncbi:efflux RND transporter periplasmic adaptor subunit [Maridesulfovibrio bastinii]|uniref:efflux RND transporter periplasmic adaptor subunit n=1 Tax=Maridesulfovibrio bastinii TaxID=47157 RepID=UPI00048258F4|nr:HlyD family secretion protein [Maridesulfovibrio bastinii]
MKQMFKKSGSILLTMIMISFAGMLGMHIWNFYMESPWTRDGRICADVVHIAPDVSGLIDKVFVKDNQQVHKGDLLFQVDPKRYTLALEQAETEVESTKATLALTQKDYNRYKALASSQAVSAQRSQVAKTDLEQARAAYNNARTKLKLARLNLKRASVKAPVNGIITNFSLRPGNYAQAGQPVAALVDSESFYIAGYFEETKLSNIMENDPVRIDIMGSSEPLFGHVTSIAGGIQDNDNHSTSGLLANVEPTFAWVRLAQRIPVRIEIDKIPEGTRLIAGRTATVTVLDDKKDGLRKICFY